jgi:HlyD family secretion protein
MVTRNRNIVAVVLCILAVAGMAAFATGPSGLAPDAVKPARSEPAAATWAAAAPGRVEARSRETKISAPTIARIAQVLVKVNDKVAPGDLLVRLDDDEALARIQAAEAQVGLRRRARNEASTPKGSANRRKAEDAVADAENALFDAQVAFDRAFVAVRTGSGKDEDVAKTRSARSAAEDRLKQKQDDLRTLKEEDDPPLPSRLEGELNVSRADLTLARTALERTRIRAPIEGVVLQVQAQPGELALPSAEQPLVTIADISSLRVRAELDERDIGKVKVGQRAVVRAGAFPGREFEGTVNSIAQIVGPGRISARGPRRLSDVDVLEVVVALTDPGPLVVGMQVDVYLSAENR